MPLTKPALVHADPGRPVTAQAWNAIVDAIGTLYDAVNALGGNALTIEVTAGASARPDARVVAVPAAGGRAIAAIAPFAGQARHQVAGLVDGNWLLKVSAAGCDDASVPITLPGTSEVTVPLTLSQSVVPDLFGLTVTQALAALATAQLGVDFIVDTAGDAVPKLNPPEPQKNAVVLVQQPAAGGYAAKNASQVRLIVSAQLETAVVAVPDLTGMSLAQASAALQAAGLDLGTTTISS